MIISRKMIKTMIKNNDNFGENEKKSKKKGLKSDNFGENDETRTQKL